MTNAEENLNTEPNDIAGNRIDGPVGNTATKHTRPGEGVGQPGGPPTSPAAATPVSSEALAAAETSMAAGAVDADTKPQENKEANPADLVPEGSYGGNFGNGTQDSYQDQDRRENQDSDPNRGEFGAQDLGGTTHGGFGNQNRLADYEPNNTAEDNYYGGPGRTGEQDNSYRSYDGRDERPDSRTEYGFEAGTATGQTPTSANPHENDNGSSKGPGSGYSADYGHTSLNPGSATDQRDGATPEVDHRNQTEDYMPAQSGTDSQGRHDTETYSTNQPEMANQRGQGYADRGRDQPNSVPDNDTGDERNGYTAAGANKGDVGQGIGSRGGSYNDAYDDSKAGSTAGSPAQGDQRAEDKAQNYGSAARQENRTDEANSADHGAPQRNAGRDGEGDE
ncbi:hypothetical protein [Hymenobacter artigasi]|uniref:Uncharacterized protein n=1 Tax=Hymenobacter artigasi TaxID=2719616 RepID=A0ABX1HBS6_9BACT|nr:hypothetical protein [Hymenobacter artigasi]NKI87639.1 hypothetical protein [Hymenobacter artigasi]